MLGGRSTLTNVHGWESTGRTETDHSYELTEVSLSVRDINEHADSDCQELGVLSPKVDTDVRHSLTR